MNCADFWGASSQHVAIKYMLVRPTQLFSYGCYKALKMVQIRSPIPILILLKKSKCHFFISAAVFRQNFNSLEIFLQAAQLKMELLWKN